MSFQPGYGTVLKIGDGDNPATATFTTIAQVTKIGNLVLESMYSEFVLHGGDGFEENIPTTQKIGDIDLELGLDTSLATHSEAAAGGLVDAWKDKTKLAYQLVLSDGGALDVKFVATVAKVDINPDPEKHVLGKVTLKPTGGPTLA
jgi:hypothetical protein